MSPGADQADPRQVQEHFCIAAAMAADEREGYLHAHCADHPALLAEVRSLLAAHDEAGDFLTSLHGDSADALVGDADEAADLRTGPYRILRELGHGGMGSVYLAERNDGQFEQQVALKLIRRGLDIDAIHQRFLTERQILARLQHPHIARLLDGGVAGDGRPYFAMEYVDGLAITEYAARRNLGIERRLRLFIDACAAVAYAHRNLVVHRDLKPSNVLVTADGQVKLLDFGIAKLLEDGPRAGRTLLTQLGIRPMTPEYAAPEQARDEPVTTATDVYALGALLYELLTGSVPHRFDGMTPADVAHVICERLPEPPSAAVLARAGSPPAPRLRRRSRRLAGDLDTIVLKALRKEPERRYRSPQELAEDVERHLQGLPVQARRDTFVYLASRFVRRNRIAVVASTVVLLSVIAGLAGIAWQATVAAGERDRARFEAAKANEVKDFVLSLFAISDPSASRGDTLTAGELLERGVDRIERELAGQPAVQADMLSVIGNVYVSLGRYDSARPLLERSLALRRGRWGDEHPEVARGLNDLGRLRYATSNFEEAAALLREALSIRRRRLPAQHAELAANLNDLALVRHDQGELAEAEVLYREALAAHRAGTAPTRAMASNMNNLAVLLQDAGRADEAEALHRRALGLRRELFGDQHPDVAESLNNLAYLHLDAGEAEAAEPLFREVLQMDRRLLGEEHPTVAISLDNLATVLILRSLPDDAIALLEQAIALHRRALGPDHARIAVSLAKMARALTLAGRLAEADARLDEAFRIYLARLGPLHPYVASALELRATIRLLEGEHSAAGELARRSLDVFREALPAGHGSLAGPLTILGAARLAAGDAAGAENPLREALEIRTASLPAGHWQLAETRAYLGACLASLGGGAEAARLLRDGHAGLLGTRGSEHPSTRIAAGYVAALLGARPDADSRGP